MRKPTKGDTLSTTKAVKLDDEESQNTALPSKPYNKPDFDKIGKVQDWKSQNFDYGK